MLMETRYYFHKSFVRMNWKLHIFMEVTRPLLTVNIFLCLFLTVHLTSGNKCNYYYYLLLHASHSFLNYKVLIPKRLWISNAKEKFHSHLFLLISFLCLINMVLSDISYFFNSLCFVIGLFFTRFLSHQYHLSFKFYDH